MAAFRTPPQDQRQTNLTQEAFMPLLLQHVGDVRSNSEPVAVNSLFRVSPQRHSAQTLSSCADDGSGFTQTSFRTAHPTSQNHHNLNDVGRPAMFQELVNGVVHGLRSDAQAQHKDVLEAIGNVMVVVEPPDLSEILAAVSQFPSAVHGLSSQLEEQKHLFRSLTARFDSLEKSMEEPINNLKECCLRIRAPANIEHRLQSAEGQMSASEHSPSQVRRTTPNTSARRDELGHSNESAVKYLRFEEPSDATPSAGDRLRLERLISQVNVLCEKLQDAPLLDAKCRPPNDVEEIAVAVQRRLESITLKIDNSEVFRALRELKINLGLGGISTMVQGSSAADMLNISNSQQELLEIVRNMHERVAETVSTRIKHTTMKVDNADVLLLLNKMLRLQPDHEALADRMHDHISKMGNDLTRTVSELAEVRAEGAIATPQPSFEVKASPRRSVDFFGQGDAPESLMPGQGRSPLQSVATVHLPSPARQSSQSYEVRREVRFDMELPFLACSCGYSCGTPAALERHLARFTNRQEHYAVHLQS